MSLVCAAHGLPVSSKSCTRQQSHHLADARTPPVLCPSHPSSCACSPCTALCLLYLAQAHADPRELGMGEAVGLLTATLSIGGFQSAGFASNHQVCLWLDGWAGWLVS